jgi:hypothetical protein
MRRGVAVLFVVLVASAAAARLPEQKPVRSVTVPFTLDHNRVFVDLEFVVDNGKGRRAHAFMDSGGGADLVVARSLIDGLHLDEAKHIHIRLGGMPLAFDEEKISIAGLPGNTVLNGEPNIEASLPSTILQNYDVVIDYAKRTLTLAPPRSLRHEGTLVSCRVNHETGVISVDMKIAGETYAVAIDNGAAYTWFSKPVVETWIEQNPDWLRGTGTIGDANMNGAPDEATAIVARAPEFLLVTMKLQQAGIVGYHNVVDSEHEDMFAWYSKKAPEPVIGWIGGNVLKSFRVELDYAENATYWMLEAPLDAHDLDQVPITINPESDGSFTVIGIAERKGQKLLDKIEPGDKLIQIGDLKTTGATIGRVLEALHGKSGETRDLVLDRIGQSVRVTAAVAQF